MNADEALAQIESLLKTRSRILPYPKRAIFLAAWEDLTYEQMVEQWHREYEVSYIRGQGSELCQELSDLLGVKVRKRTFREEVEAGLTHQLQMAASSEATSTATKPPSLLDGADTRWVGRESVVDSLRQKLLGNCRLLSIVGLTGIGKTSLAARLLSDDRLQHQLPIQKAVILDQTLPNFENLVTALLGTSSTTNSDRAQNLDVLVGAMVARLKTEPCLLVLDMVEEVLAGDGKGGIRFVDPAFGRFLEQVIRASEMPSRVILTSQEQPPLALQGRYPERTYLQRLSGLSETEAMQLFVEWGVVVAANREEETLLKRIIQAYEGHPLALQVIAGEIQSDPYAGNVQSYWTEFESEFLAIEQQKSAEEVRSQSDRLRLTCYRPQLQDIVQARIEQVFQRLSSADPLAYRLLLMAASYRRAVEPAAWHRLLDEYPLELAHSAFHSLERRYLIERERYQNLVLYRQHSLIRCVALQQPVETEEEMTPYGY